MRFNEGKKLFCWLAGAATLLLASAQPALAKCEAQTWDDNLDITIIDSEFEDHIPTHAKFELKKRFLLCHVRMETVRDFDHDFDNLRFKCDWTGQKSLLPAVRNPPWAGLPHCVSTRSVRLHPDANGKPKKHRVTLVPYFTANKRKVDVYLVDEDDMTTHAGVAHGTGDE
jgi:hypothetical protein